MNAIFNLVAYELTRSKKKYPPINNRHEAYAVIKEEIDEYWEKVKEKDPNPRDLEDELIQVAAMAIRAIEDTCQE